MKLKLCLLSLSVLIWIAGCTSVGVDYKPPETDTSAEWSTRLNNPILAETENPDLLKNWWTLFNDEKLNILVEKAMRGNLDVKSAYYSFTAARATVKVKETDRLPTFTASGSTKHSHYADTSLSEQDVNTYTTGIDASWEIDLFGKTSRSVEATLADMQATDEAMHDVMVSLLAELATNYINLRSLQYRLEITEEDIHIKQVLNDIAERSFNAGLSDASEAKEAIYNLEYAKTAVYDLKSSLNETLNRLAVLTGQKPGALQEILKAREEIPPVPVKIISAIPADMVRRRPDIRQAERKLAAQTARIGVAEAEKYPSFTLGGSINYSVDSSGSLFNASNSSISLGPSFSWAIFDLGAVKQNINVQTATQQKYLVDYESAVLTAMEEVENALSSFDHEYQKNIQLKKAYDLVSEAYDLALKKYQSGLSDYTDVITAETSYISYKKEHIISTANANIHIISLYKALGGGWESFNLQEQE